MPWFRIWKSENNEGEAPSGDFSLQHASDVYRSSGPREMLRIFPLTQPND